MASVSLRDAVVHGVRSPVRESTPALARDAREAVLFLHGNPGSSEDWVDLLGRTGEFARAVAPDMPGYGKADRPSGFDYTVAGYARHLGGVIAKLGIDRVHLVLHDFGGPWGLTWAADHPKAVASVTLVNIGVLAGYRWHKFARVWRTPVLGEIAQLTVTRFAFRMALNRDNPRPFPTAFLDRMYEDSDWGMKRAVLKLYRATSDIDGMSRAIAERLTPLQLPGLVLWGAGDSYVPARYAAEQAKYFGSAEVHVLEGCGHWPFIDEPEKCAGLIVPFLRRRVGVGAEGIGGVDAG
jgi:pimeloyl-ACP methyl ester carboxylesterase